MVRKSCRNNTPAAPSEHSEQSRFFAALRRVSHPAASVTFAVPNGFLRTSSARLRAWREGVLSGVSDVFVPAAHHGFHGLFLEFKTARGRVSAEQQTFLSGVRAAGFAAVVVRSARDGLMIFSAYITPTSHFADVIHAYLASEK